MLKWLRYLTLLPQLAGFLAGILQLVREAEDLVAGGQRGAEKKALVLDLVEAAIALGRGLGIREVEGVDPARVREGLGPIVDAVVAALNALGVFKHGAEASG